jgi:hypothetical protein
VVLIAHIYAIYSRSRVVLVTLGGLLLALIIGDIVSICWYLRHHVQTSGFIARREVRKLRHGAECSPIFSSVSLTTCVEFHHKLIRNVTVVSTNYYRTIECE